MEEKIFFAIATHTPFSVQDIKWVYKHFNSYDKTIIICKFASKIGISLQVIVDFVEKFSIPQRIEVQIKGSDLNNWINVKK